VPVASHNNALGTRAHSPGLRWARTKGGGKLIVVAEYGLASSWVRNAVDREGRLRVFYRGGWREARLKPRPGDPEVYLRQMSRTHAALVRMESSSPALVEITPE